MQFQRVAQQPATNAIKSGPRRNPEATHRYSTEKGSADIHRVLAGHDFSSLDEANEFLTAAMAYRNAQLGGGGEPAAEPTIALDSGVTFKLRGDRPGLEKARPSQTEISEMWTRAEAGKSDLETAQDLMYEAWKEAAPRRVGLAREALAISKDCADAYVLLGQEAGDLPEAKALFETALDVAARGLGKDACEEGGFWTRLETRPYMRARASLAGTLWAMGERDQAIGHLKEQLRLNPGDNQGLRYQLVHWLLLENREQDLIDLFDAYAEEPTASLQFSRALYLYRLKGDSVEANSALGRALAINTDVTHFLLGRKCLPEVMPAYVGYGDEDEAVEYVAMAREEWSQTPGALDWLQTVSEGVASRMRHPAHKLWLNYMDSAERNMAEGQFRKAKGQLLYALRQAEKFGEDEFLANTLSRLSLVCLEAGPTADDEQFCKRATDLTEAIRGPNDRFLAVDLHNLACLYVELKRIDEAEPIFARAAEIAERRGDKHLLSSILRRQADIFDSQGKRELAREARQRSKQLHSELDEHDHEHTENCSHVGH